MPNYDLNVLRANLKTLLETVASVAFVYDRRNPTIEGYPCIIFDVVENNNIMLTNVENERTITFRIWLVQEIGVAGMATANDLLDTLTNETVTILESISNITLSNTATWLMPNVGGRQEVSSPQGSAIWQVLNLQVRVVSNVL